MSVWRTGLVLVSIVSAVLLFTVTRAAPPCDGCASFQPMSASTQRFHFPVNGPGISAVLSPASHDGAWFVGTNAYGTDGFIGRIEGGAIVYFNRTIEGSGNSALAWGGTSLFVTDRKAGILQFMMSGQTATYSLPAAHLSSADEISFDNTGTLWVLRTIQSPPFTMTRQLLAIDMNPPGQPRPGPLLPGFPEAFEQDPGNADLLLSNGEIVRLSGNRTPVVVATSAAAARNGSFALAPDGSQWLSDPVGIYHIRTDGTRTLIRLRETEPIGSFAWFWWPFVVAPDGAAWTNFDDRLCRIALNDTMRCANVPSPQLSTLSFASDGSAWYAVNESPQNEIVHAYFNGGAAGSPTLGGDVVLYTAPAHHASVRDIDRLSGFADRFTLGHDARLYLRLVQNVPREFAVDRGGTVWYAAPGALVHLSAAGYKMVHRLPSTRGTPATPQALAASPDGSLWFGYRGALCRFADGSSSCFPLDAGLGVRRIVIGNDASAWFIAGDHVIAHFRL